MDFVDKVQQIKMSVDLVSFVERDLGDPKSRHGGSEWWCCPFHSEHTPSFKVDRATNRWRCFGACNTGGDAIDYIMRRENCDIKRAVEILDGGSFSSPAVAPTTVEERKQKPQPTMDDVLSYRSSQPRTLAVKYFGHRGMDTATVDSRLMGTQMNYSWGYEFKNQIRADRYKDGKTWFKGRRYTIPWLSGQSVKSINKRRDDTFITEAWMMTDAAIRRDVLDDIAESYKYANRRDIPASKVLHHAFGPKYHRDGNDYWAYNVNRLFVLDDAGEVVVENGSPMLARLPYVLIVEGECDAAIGEQYGYATVAAKRGRQYEQFYVKAFSNIHQIYIVADSDEAGVEYASQMRRALGRGQIMTLPLGYKDLNDLALGNQLDNWLGDQKRINPFLKEIA